MNEWECQGCHTRVLGCGGAIGLRAIGWQFETGPKIRCPRCRDDVCSGDFGIKKGTRQATHLQFVLKAFHLEPYF